MEVITKNLLEKASAFFSNPLIVKAKKLYPSIHTNISFQKGDASRFVVSAIVSDSQSFQTKVTYKDETFSSQCSCIDHSKEEHCVHSAVLFFKFFTTIALKEKVGQSSQDPLTHAKLTGNYSGVHVEDYGTILHGAQYLVGARPNSTYSSVQYLLTNKKVQNLPLPQKLDGRLRMNLVPAASIPAYQHFPQVEEKFIPIFSYLSPTGEESKNISLFEHFYIFNWDNGQAIDLPNELKTFIKKVLREGVVQHHNLYLRWGHDLIESQNFEFSINGKALDQLEYKKANYRYSINQASRKSFLELKIELFDDNFTLLTPPPLYQILTQEGGFLGQFRTKQDSHNFIMGLLESIETGSQNYKKHLHSTKAKQEINEWIEFIFSHEQIPFFSHKTESLYYIEKKSFLAQFQALVHSFDTHTTRFSFFKKQDQTVTFQIPKNHLLNHVTYLYDHLKRFNIPLFYQEKEVKTWQSNIRFERRKSDLDWFELNLVVNEQDMAIIAGASQGDNFLLHDGNLVILENKEQDLLRFMKKYTTVEAKSQNKGQNKNNQFELSFKRARIFELFELKKHGIDGALTEQEEALCQNLLGLEQMPEYSLPTGLKAEPRPYQKQGYNWLKFLYENKFGACLADDMGLGKTLQTIMFLESIKEQVQKVLIVCPVSILINWKAEIERFSNIDVDVYYGNDREFKPSSRFILTSYGLLKKESFALFSEIKFDILVMDEVQHLKNIRSQGAMAARNIKADFRICLTGTPVENDLSEFYNIMDLSIPGIWGDLSMFRTRSSKKSRLLARKTVRPFILRRTKAQVLTELPEKVENHVYLNFSDEEKEFYLKNLVEIKNRMNSVQKGRKYSEILKSLLKLRQLCLWQQQQMLKSTKVDYLIENLEQLVNEGHKVLVFSQFTTYLDLIQNKVRENSWQYARIDGSQTLKKRASEVERFQNGNAQVFLISLKAGGVGLNLTAASYIFLMDPWWNPAVESQAIDRAYRIGQTNNLTVYRPIIKDTVEEKVLVLQNSKRELFKDLMDSDEGSFYDGKLTMEDFQQLLS